MTSNFALWKCLLAALSLCAGVSAWSQEPCTSAHVELPREQTGATARSLANLVKSPGSLRAVLAAVLSNAREQLAEVKPPGNACSPLCRITEPARILLKVVPQKLLTNYADVHKCEERLEQTSNQPLRFGPHHVRSADELAAWLSDVAQGRGRDGMVLYQECGGQCSPRYSAEVSQDGSGLVATLDVVCGHARDKEDNTYSVSSSYRWACVAGR